VIELPKGRRSILRLSLSECCWSGLIKRGFVGGRSESVASSYTCNTSEDTAETFELVGPYLTSTCTLSPTSLLEAQDRFWHSLTLIFCFSPFKLGGRDRERTQKKFHEQGMGRARQWRAHFVHPSTLIPYLVARYVARC
jgi:hypothetical protein